MTQRVVVTGFKYVHEVKDEFYFSSQTEFGGGAEVGDAVAVVSEKTGNLLAQGEIVEKGKPREECRTVQITKRFE